MKCECEECQGTGSIPCPECAGHGWVQGGIDEVALPPSHEHFEEIQELKRDADKARDAAQWLMATKPEHVESYARQLAWTLEAIAKQAAMLLKEAA